MRALVGGNGFLKILGVMNLSPEHDQFRGSLKIKGLGSRAWTDLTPSVCHGALLAPPPEPSFEFYFVVLCNREGSQQCPVTRGGRQVGPGPGP